MAAVAERMAVADQLDQEVATLLADELESHAPELQRRWIEVLRERGLLAHLAGDDLIRECESGFRVWCDFFRADRIEGATARARWMAERSVLIGRSIDETLHSFLALRNTCREHILRTYHSDSEQLQRVLPVFERMAQHLMVHIAAGCAEERERLVRQRMRALVEAGMLLTAEQGLERVLQKIVDLARDIVGARYAAMAVVDDQDQISHFATSGMDERTLARLGELPSGRGVLGAVFREPVRLADIQADPRSIGFPPDHPAMHSFLGVPVASRGRLYGNLYLTDKRDGASFSPEDELLVTTFASQAAAAIENARSIENLRLLEESQRREKQHSELLQRVIAAQEEERKRVARELHDHTGQSLTSLMIGLRRLESGVLPEEGRAAIAEMRQHAVQALDELHHLAFELRPSVLDDLGLAVALERYVADFGRRTAIHLTTQFDALRGLRLEPAVEIALYRIVQEALTNVAKHAQAPSASVVVQIRGGSLLLIVEDTGRGFEVPDSGTAGKHFGLMGMHERINLLGGKLTIESAPGAGTTVYAEVPVARP